MSNPRDRFLTALREALTDGSLVKLTLGKPRDPADDRRNLYVRPVTLQAGPRWSCVWRHRNRDITKNLPTAEAVATLPDLIGPTFRDAHLFTPALQAQLETQADDTVRVKFRVLAEAPSLAPTAHDRTKTRALPPASPWLRSLGVTDELGRPRPGQAAKFRQIQHYGELLIPLAEAAGLARDQPARIADMGCGKGYLTFAVADLWGDHAEVQGVETRRDLVAAANRIATSSGFTRLRFSAGRIGEVDTGPLDLLIALHACDTATDDALAAGIAAGARLLVVAPCCQKELRPQLQPATVLAPALRHGIFAERHAEFLTDALRALLLEAAGWHTRVSEFISTEHTARNLMLAAWRGPGRIDRAAALAQAQALAALYGVTRHRLADHLGLSLTAS